MQIFKNVLTTFILVASTAAYANTNSTYQAVNISPAMSAVLISPKFSAAVQMARQYANGQQIQITSISTVNIDGNVYVHFNLAKRSSTGNSPLTSAGTIEAQVHSNPDGSSTVDGAWWKPDAPPPSGGGISNEGAK
jgi:hypothetical protein